MAARIVYEGAARGSGDLFQGKTFWLSHRIPMRNYWKEQLESNGGTVVQLEINADMIIVDHARKDCPPGSISWTWIEYSLRNGILEDIEGHRAGPAQAQVREVGSTQPTKKTRTKFSPEDDRILMEWVTRAERKGSSILGNIIYQQLAQKYPHHTWQSWLDRWKRYVSTKKRPTLPEDDEDEDEDDVESALVAPKPKQPRKLPSISRRDRRPVRISVSPPPKSRPKSHKELPNESSIVSPVPSARSQNSSTSLQANPFLLKSTGGNVFTNEETQLLFDAYDAVIDLSDDQVIDAWIAWSAANPTHTPQEWRNHFKEYVAPTQLARINSAKSARQSKEMPPPKFNPARNATSNSNQAPEIKDSQGSSGQTVPTPAKGVDNSTSFTHDSREFAKNLWTLADSLDLEVDPKPVIREKVIKLFDLWRIVTSNEFGGFDEVTGRRKWSKVAERLGFEVIQQKEAGKDLQACYSEILCDLEQAERELQDSDDITSEQEAELIADQLRQTAEQPDSVHGEEEEFSHDQEEEQFLVAEEEHERLLREQEENDDDLNHIQISPRRPQPPSPSAGKRRSGSDRRSSDLPNTKRQRIDKGKGKEQLEIPSTPEDVINNTQISRPPHQPSPLKFGQAEPSSPSTDSLMEEVRPIKLERKRSAAAQQLEPETQDFYHPTPAYPPRPQEGDIEDDDEVILGSYREPQGDKSDGEDEEESSFVKPGPPHSQGRGSQRNSSNATTRGTLHSSNNVSNAATRDTINSSSTNYESSTQSQTESQTGALLEAFITKHVSDGYAQDVVIKALESTSMSLKETLAVMESLANGEGIPEDMPGVWTSWDDEALRAGRGTEDYDRVVRKHGISRISERKKYWRDYLATED
ncbi:hypothetical protein BKA64DRAFT_359350 [Cadophora sp. MPI-SDFR-AT-0126]|nr:hypothetical protein BKA64DRAFT_359350 [Leotiomycetes sp. MPI-SDFR-AT-0126]